MNEEQKRQVAIFRLGVIHDIVGGVRLGSGESNSGRSGGSVRGNGPFPTPPGDG